MINNKDNTKINTSMRLDKKLLEWLDLKIKNKRFASRTHAVELALTLLKEKYDKEEEIN